MSVRMDTLITEILDAIRIQGSLSSDELARIIYQRNKGVKDNSKHFAKKRLLPYYLRVKGEEPERWQSWKVSEELEQALVRTLQVKPRRTASGVATITVITKPWICSNNCVYCPNDIRMPKSYLSDEPACQRAERNFFDPYLQVASRLKALTHMGHSTDKIELIVLGGTWNDYPSAYRFWYTKEMFRALNDPEEARDAECLRILDSYESEGLSGQEADLAAFACEQQDAIERGDISYNAACKTLYQDSPLWQGIARLQTSDLAELQSQHTINETAQHRVVGLVVETRPDMITCESLTQLRQLGCTKIQMGIQSVNQAILKANNRRTTLRSIEQAFSLLRIFGFKVHAHFMLNLLQSTPQADYEDFQRFVSESSYLPDEIKLYPCSLIKGTELMGHFQDGSWQPYSEDELVDLLTKCALATPPYMRISRMIRDISACDIVAGNKKANLRQMVEARIAELGTPMQEIRYREISTDQVDSAELHLDFVEYATTASDEVFFQWLTPEGKIAGFLRLSLPKAEYLASPACSEESLPVAADEAMIREVHVYGKAARLHTSDTGVQHLGLGRKLLDNAAELARKRGYAKLNVISSVGTREYYRGLGFADNGLYQQMQLAED